MCKPDKPLDTGGGSVRNRVVLARKVWLFDLDGTLVDSSRGVVRAFHAAQVAHGEPPAPDAAIRARIGYPLMETVAMLSRVPWADFFPHFRQEAMATMHHDTRVLPGILELLPGLKQRGCRMALVTSKRADNAQLILNHLHLASFFEVIVGSDAVERTKPDSEPIRAALSGLGADPASALMVGDTAADIEAAHGAGVPVIALRCGFETDERLRGADLVVADAVALWKLVEAVRCPT